MPEPPEPKIEDRTERPYLAIHCRITEGVPAAVDEAFPALFAWLGEHRIEPAGPPFIRMLELDTAGEPLELEVGAPVAQPHPGGDRAQARMLPAGRYLTMLHRGPYRHASVPDLAVSRSRLHHWAAEQGLAWGRETARGTTPACSIESYRVGPPMESDWTRWETEFAYLIVE